LRVLPNTHTTKSSRLFVFDKNIKSHYSVKFVIVCVCVCVWMFAYIYVKLCYHKQPLVLTTSIFRMHINVRLNDTVLLRTHKTIYIRPRIPSLGRRKQTRSGKHGRLGTMLFWDVCENMRHMWPFHGWRIPVNLSRCRC
jgi:hypothetical protein